MSLPSTSPHLGLGPGQTVKYCCVLCPHLFGLFSRVVQNVVLLSDSQLHLFLQSQLSVPEIEACMRGQSPLTVTEAILHYALSNCGWVQEEDGCSAVLTRGNRHGR